MIGFQMKMIRWRLQLQCNAWATILTRYRRWWSNYQNNLLVSFPWMKIVIFFSSFHLLEVFVAHFIAISRVYVCVCVHCQPTKEKEKKIVHSMDCVTWPILAIVYTDNENKTDKKRRTHKPKPKKMEKKIAIKIVLRVSKHKSINSLANRTKFMILDGHIAHSIW